MKTTYTLRNPKLLLIFIFLLSVNFKLKAQEKTGQIKGIVTTSDNKAAADVNVYLKELQKTTYTDANGGYSFTGLTEGTYHISVSFVGRKSEHKTVSVIPGKVSTADIILEETSGQLKEVVITGYKTSNEKPVSVGKVSIAPMDLPQSISVVNSQLIADQQGSRLSDVLKNVNGVALGTTRGSTSETFYARGYSLGSNNIFKNGARANSGAIPEASTLEKIEVLKGSAALLYGNVSGGAIINMVTKQPKFNYGGEVSLRAGSYNLYKPTGDIYGPVTKDVAFRLIGTYEDAGSYRKNVQSKRTYINPSLLYNIGKKTSLLLQADYLKYDNTPDFGIGSLGGKIPTMISRSSYFNTPWAYNKVNQSTVSANLDHQFNKAWKLTFLGSYQAFNRNYFSTERIQADTIGDWSRNLTRSKISEDYYTGQVNLTGEFRTGNIEHKILVGTDAERYLNTTHGFDLTTAYDKINVLHPTKYVARTDEPNAPMISQTQTPTYRLGYYAQDLISLSEKFKVLAGLRWSYEEISVAKTRNFATGEVTNNPAGDKFEKAFSPRLGVVYQPTKNTSLFASYSNNFAPNRGLDIYGANLKASIIDQYEAGVKNDFLEGKFSANFTLYRIVNNDLAQQAQFDSQGNENFDSNVKEFTGQTTSDGAEIDLTGTLAKGLNFVAGYSYNFMRYTKTPGSKGSYIEGERLVNNTAHTANTTLFYTFNTTKLKGLKVGASAFYTGKRNAGWNNTVGQTQVGSRLIPVSGFTTIDLSLGYAYKNLSILGKVSNLTDELNYYVHENYSVNPIAPRQFITTLAYKF
ncbi:TonB-dependent siderophore receptor [Rubrolithibacter danxiaensis]|uniref:TonB-dependent siderophore receptor n=1 Tax=Rubrolithibacter danxiaensis TaxID=3390805 RepID=UPI003BF805D4